MNNLKKIFVVFVLLFGLVPTTAHAEKPKEPILVIDKCPEFCQPPVKMCTQALLPVPGRPGYWYTDGCKKRIIKGPKPYENCLIGVRNGKGYMPTRECVEFIRGQR
jgi:hypothetical protein